MVALTTLTSVANAYFQVLASQDRIAPPSAISPATRILDAIKQRCKPAQEPTSTSRSESRSRQSKALVPPLRQTLALNINALATLVSRRGVHVAGGSMNQISSPQSRRAAVRLLTQRPDIRRQEAQLASHHR